MIHARGLQVCEFAKAFPLPSFAPPVP